MTSNLGSDVIQTMTQEGKSYDEMRDAVMDIVGGHFRPEFINRIDESVVFHPLKQEQIRGIADIQLQLLRDRLAERDLSLELSDAAINKLVEVGYEDRKSTRLNSSHVRISYAVFCLKKKKKKRK